MTINMLTGNGFTSIISISGSSLLIVILLPYGLLVIIALAEAVSALLLGATKLVGRQRDVVELEEEDDSFC